MPARIDIKRIAAAVAKAESEMDTLIPAALRMIGERIASDAKAGATFKDRTGRLRASIKPGEVTQRGNSWSVDILAGGVGGVRYAAFVHDGTRPHIIRAAEAKGDRVRVRMVGGTAVTSFVRDRRPKPHLRFVGRGGEFVFRKEVHHPGTTPRPFILEALNRNQEWAERQLAAATKLAFVRAGFQGRSLG